MESETPKLLFKTPEYLNQSLQQLFYYREKAIITYVKARKDVAKIEMEISTSACPWQLGQYVNYMDFEKNTSRKAIIARIKFTPEPPYYIVYIRLCYTPRKTKLIDKKCAYGRIEKVDHIASIIGVTNFDPIDRETLTKLIEDDIVRLESFVDSEDAEFSRNIFMSYERGKKLTKLSPHAEFWIRESLRLGSKPETLETSAESEKIFFSKKRTRKSSKSKKRSTGRPNRKTQPRPNNKRIRK